MMNRIPDALCALFLAVMAGWPLASTAQNTHTLPLVMPASNAALTGFVRIINRSFQSGTVRITAIDDAGSRFGPVSLTLDAEETVNFNSRDLEQGNASKGLPSGVGDGEGDWRVVLDTDLGITPLAYIRTADGFVTSMHDVAPETAEGSRRYRVAFFNPGSNRRQVSRLRLINPGTSPARVEITARDDAGMAAPGGPVRLTLAAGAARTLTAQEIEAGGAGIDGSLGDGAGKWRLSVVSSVAVEVMSLLASPTGHLANLSSAPEPAPADGLALPLVLPASGTALTGFVRIVNRSGEAGPVRMTAIDDTGERLGPVTLSLEANETVNFNSRDLEQGNASKGMPVGVGDGEGDWRLEVDTALDVAALAYIRTSDGFVTGMHDVVPDTDGNHRVTFFNPGSNRRQVSRLRLINPGADVADVTIQGRDDAGVPAPGGVVRLTLAPGAARTLTAQEIEAGGAGIDGSLGDGAGKWWLSVTADRTIEVISLLRSPTGHLSNLSTEPPSADGPVTFAGADSLDASGGEFSGQLDSPGDVDYYRVTVDEPSILTMNVSSDADVVVTVFDERGNMIPQLVPRATTARAGAAVASVAVLVPSGRSMVRVSTRYGRSTVGGNVEFYRLASRVMGIGLRQIRPFPETELIGSGSVSIDLRPYFAGVNGVAGLYLEPLRVRTPWGPLDVSLSAGLVLTVNKPAWNLQLFECGDGEDELRLTVKVKLRWFDSLSFPLSQGFGAVPLVLRRPGEGAGAPRRIAGTAESIFVSVAAGASETVRLTDYIEDPEGGPLTFSVSSVPSSWRAAASGTLLTVTAGAEAANGSMTVTARKRGSCMNFPVALRVTGGLACCDYGRVTYDEVSWNQCECRPLSGVQSCRDTPYRFRGTTLASGGANVERCPSYGVCCYVAGGSGKYCQCYSPGEDPENGVWSCDNPGSVRAGQVSVAFCPPSRGSNTPGQRDFRDFSEILQSPSREQRGSDFKGIVERLQTPAPALQ